MQKSKKLILLATIAVSSIQACDIKDNEAEPETSFVQIYNNDHFTGGYSPVDVKQNADSSFTVLGTTGTWDSYLMHIDRNGKFRWHLELPEAYVNPVGELMQVQDDLYFVCMNNITLNSYIMKVNKQSGAVEETQSLPLTYPLHASQTPDKGMLILGYDRNSLSTTLSKLDPSFNITWTRRYDVLEDAEDAIIAHISKTGEILPFLTGYSGEGTATKFFFNGFSEFTFSFHFVNTSDGAVSGTIEGFKQKGGISAALSLQDNKYAFSRFNYGDNYFHPFHDVNVNAIVYSGDMPGNSFPEISPYAKVKALKFERYGKKILLYGTETKNNHIALYAYDATNGNLIGTRYLGRTNPFNFGSFSLTNDGGLVVTGTTHLAGRFPRIVVFKLSENELDELAGM